LCNGKFSQGKHLVSGRFGIFTEEIFRVLRTKVPDLPYLHKREKEHKGHRLGKSVNAETEFPPLVTGD